MKYLINTFMVLNDVTSWFCAVHQLIFSIISSITEWMVWWWIPGVSTRHLNVPLDQEWTRKRNVVSGQIDETVTNWDVTLKRYHFCYLFVMWSFWNEFICCLQIRLIKISKIQQLRCLFFSTTEFTKCIITTDIIWMFHKLFGIYRLE